jgi:hypothetical protein
MSEEYNYEPVWYCNTCYSLRIFNSSGSDYDIDGDITPCYCDSCGSTDIAVTKDNGIEEVLKLQKSREKELSKRIKRK